MAENEDKPPDDDAGLAALLMMLQFHGIAADGAQIRHQLGGIAVGVPEIVRCAREFGLKSREHRTSWRRLEKTPLPAIAPLRDGGFVILGKVLGQDAGTTVDTDPGAAAGGKILVQFPLSPR